MWTTRSLPFRYRIFPNCRAGAEVSGQGVAGAAAGVDGEAGRVDVEVDHLRVRAGHGSSHPRTFQGRINDFDSSMEYH
jgi:hypothetical protein